MPGTMCSKGGEDVKGEEFRTWEELDWIATDLLEISSVGLPKGRDPKCLNEERDEKVPAPRREHNK